jgi:hypothetical protein
LAGRCVDIACWPGIVADHDAAGIVGSMIHDAAGIGRSMGHDGGWAEAHPL